MAEYTVYAPPNAAGDPAERAERLVFVKEGFRWWAALLPAVWLLVKGLWLELAVCLGVIAAITWGLPKLGANDEAAGLVLLIAQVILGFEAATLEGAALERRGWREIGLIEGRNLAEAERRFLVGWLPSQAASAVESWPAPAKGPLALMTEAALQSARSAAARWRLPGAKA